MIKDDLKAGLAQIFNGRVAFHRTELMLYSTDIGFLPAMARATINTMPDAVVQPLNSGEIKDLISLAGKHGVPVIPRGAATSGYGGVLPVRGGIVVDFTRMNKVIDIDLNKNVATVEPGVRWNDLEKALRKKGLALRLYPGSAISATVGGWIATGGGVGIGSFEYGYLKDNLVDVELITADGTTVLSGDRIDLVNGMAGTTGFISKVSLRTRQAADDVPVLASFKTIQDVCALFNELKASGIPLWEAGFRNPLHVELTGRAEVQQDNQFIKHEDSHKQGLPNGMFLALFVYPSDREGAASGPLQKLIEAHGGQVLDKVLAKNEWDERFFPLRLKALGPSVIPSEVDIPVSGLAKFADEIQKGMKGLAFNGTLINGGDRTTVLTYMLGDERRLGFMFGYASGFTPLKIAAAVGGRPYTIGMYLSDRAEKYFGKEKLAGILEFKHKADPKSILNPGKVFPRSMDRTAPALLGFMLKIAGGMGPLMQIARNILGSDSRGLKRASKTVVKDLPFGKEAVWDAYACVGCGYCGSICTEYGTLGWESASPRGKFHFLREYVNGNVKFDERMGEIFYACTTCGHCNEVCQIKSHIEEHWVLTGRAAAWLDGYNPPQVSQVTASHALLRHNPAGMPQDKRLGWKAPGLKMAEEGEIAYFVGCNASYNQETRNLPVNSVRILNKAGIEPVYLGAQEWCCGGSVYAAGCVGEYEETLRHNMEEFKRRGVKTVLVSCGSCYYYLGHIYPILAKQYGIEYGITVRHMAEYMDELIREGKLKPKFPVKFPITYHDPCHLACAGHIADQPRRVLASIPELQVNEMEHIGLDTLCCGRHTSRYPHYGGDINNRRLEEALGKSVPALVSSCPTCETNFRNNIKARGEQLEVLDITDLVAESLGLPTLIVSKISKIMKGTPTPVEKKEEGVQSFLSEEELTKENNMFQPKAATYSELHRRQGSVKKISEELGESTDNTKVPKSC